MNQTIPFARPDTGAGEAKAVAAVLNSGWVGKGPVVAAFELALSTQLMGAEVVAVSSATAGLFLSLSAFGVGEGDEVITTPMTFSATAAAILQTGAKPVFADIGSDLNIDPTSLAEQITKKTKAAITVDYAGNPCNYRAIVGVAKAHDDLFQKNARTDAQSSLGRMLVLADAAHAFGSKLNNKPISQHADIAVFSFHATKNITTGDGGAIALNPQLQWKGFAKVIRATSNHGMDADAHTRQQQNTWRYNITRLGYKMNMTDIEAAIGLAQLHRLETFLQQRRGLVVAYKSLLSELPNVQTNIALTKERQSACHLMSICVSGISEAERDQLIELMHEKNIECAVHYTPLPRMGLYRQLGYTMKDLPTTDEQARKQLSLPLFSQMALAEVEQVASALKDNLTRLG